MNGREALSGESQWETSSTVSLSNRAGDSPAIASLRAGQASPVGPDSPRVVEEGRAWWRSGRGSRGCEPSWTVGGRRGRGAQAQAFGDVAAGMVAEADRLQVAGVDPTVQGADAFGRLGGVLGDVGGDLAV